MKQLKLKKLVKCTNEKNEDYEVPEELQQKFEEFPRLKEAFYQLTPGR